MFFFNPTFYGSLIHVPFFDISFILSYLSKFLLLSLQSVQWQAFYQYFVLVYLPLKTKYITVPLPIVLAWGAVTCRQTFKKTNVYKSAEILFLFFIFIFIFNLCVLSSTHL